MVSSMRVCVCVFGCILWNICNDKLAIAHNFNIISNRVAIYRHVWYCYATDIHIFSAFKILANKWLVIKCYGAQKIYQLFVSSFLYIFSTFFFLLYGISAFLLHSTSCWHTHIPTFVLFRLIFCRIYYTAPSVYTKWFRNNKIFMCLKFHVFLASQFNLFTFIKDINKACSQVFFFFLILFYQ